MHFHIYCISNKTTEFTLQSQITPILHTLLQCYLVTFPSGTAVHFSNPPEGLVTALTNRRIGLKCHCASSRHIS